ncbi:deoxyribodipyrimidine photolyase-related protein [Rhodothalassium salexigens DSM 2132]|uniref:Deoxyribodipyrimidine photolyase-related protein n=1 Tax=Rhodothalassium salexigens DSM 2132 TaxID=1188247 RepID=A0A4R2PET5_RHOSA|nr:cryptochrome/photolyase family protein [Rhodothalassium salexigens]MBB4212130.1 deoxyribodipyrimidine photolyase-related protein [Rhodothalassium salexigens DSM 2132]MBK1638202.1 cryptochrome/photolyase family protein [Rhodothalassium salexigens DSM 2132]TCP33004.1 deoxyribodipyrimidine photolyase-related protein [Rhodothalassium salexigens DSM 2132]
MTSSCALIPVFADQLSDGLASLAAGVPDRDLVVMAEVAEEVGYADHHQKKLAFLFSAMRHFALRLRGQGWRVRYTRLDDPANSGSLTGEVARAAAAEAAGRVLVTEPGEYRVAAMIDRWPEHLGLAVERFADDRFVCSPGDFARWAEGRKTLRMEYFYRDMRRRTGLLMAGDAPEGGRWNYDADNRKPAEADLFMPAPHRVEPDAITTDVLAMVEARCGDHFGRLRPFWFAVTHDQAEAALDQFIAAALPRFGDYQDAMLRGERFLYHSVLSVYLNAGLLDPLAVCRRAEAAYYDGHAPLNAVEGFIRQIIGWREFIRGVYWLHMPGYTAQNHLGAARALPGFYWTGDTHMACLAEAIAQTRDEAYAHHIQRLMVTGNFALLAGLDPAAVHRWYLAVYVDAFEWVEAPNTLGMSLYADGGLFASKPYAAGGNYINKMSDYCRDCHYKVSKKSGPDACPFNYLYWDFLDRNAEILGANPRLGPVYRTWGRMADDKRQAARDSAARFLARLDAGERV